MKDTDPDTECNELAHRLAELNVKELILNCSTRCFRTGEQVPLNCRFNVDELPKAGGRLFLFIENLSGLEDGLRYLELRGKLYRNRVDLRGNVVEIFQFS